MQHRNLSDVEAWLRRRPSLAELRREYEGEWQRVERELADVLRQEDVASLEEYLASLSAPAAPRGHDRGQRKTRALLSAQIRRQMAVAALKQRSVSAATGVDRGRVRFNVLNGYLAQKLLFAHDLERKPVSLSWFRLIWPLLWQRRRLMPLVQPKGIYCFYSRKLIRELAAMIGERPCLEIAAGDGTLSRFLAAEGVAVTATDDYSWDDNVRYPADVVRQDACSALRTHKPRAVVCSWPPPGNKFEDRVFATDSVELYVVINTGLELGSGNRAAYAEQEDFAHNEDAALGRLVLPPELGSTVHVFERTRA